MKQDERLLKPTNTCGSFDLRDAVYFFVKNIIW